MARKARLIVPGYPHHVEQRAHDFFTSEARVCRYLVHLIEETKRFRTKVLGWCLAPDWVRLVLVPPDKEALGLLIRATHILYVRENNWLTDGGEALLRERFKSCVLSPDYVAVAVRAAELAPVRAGAVERPEHWPWSSARYHLGLSPVDYLMRRRVVPELVADWREWLGLSDEPAEAYLARCARTGWPCGPEGFAEQVGKRLRRKLQRRKPGPEPREIAVWGGRRYGWYIKERKKKK